MVDLYASGRYATANPDWHEADAPHKADALAQAIRFAGLAPRTVIDVGCGTGGVLVRLKALLDPELPETSYEGWDVAPEAIRRARTREGERLTFVEGEFLASERQADLLLAIDVIEHVADDLAFLDGLRSRADWFLFRIPLDLSALDVVRPGRLLDARRRFGHLHFYTREMAIDRLIGAGYRIETVRYDR
ncbi:MAG: class I SAM-dependent methyltransferase, partial [Myxococcota bacterium]